LSADQRKFQPDLDSHPWRREHQRHLQFNGMDQPSTFQNSCAGIGIAGATLFAHCRRIDGGFNRTSILVPGIANINGVLRYQ